MPHAPFAPSPDARSPDAAAPTRPRVCGHFGELVQGRLGPSGPVALISLPCPALWVEPGAPEPAGPARFEATLAPARLSALCAALDCPEPDRPPRLRAAMPPGGGAGSSTAGLVASARLLGFDGPPERLARICARIEGASDPLMFPAAERLLFAPRAGRVLRALPALPRFTVLGGFFGPPRATDPADTAFPDISDLLAGWTDGLALPAMAALASESARRCLRLRGPLPDPTEALARALGALGWLIAHTGSARGLIFAPGTVPAGAGAALRAAGFTQVVQFDAGGGA